MRIFLSLSPTGNAGVPNNLNETRNSKPDYILILPWNIKDEITEQLSYIREWKGNFVVAVPEIKVIEDTR